MKFSFVKNDKSTAMDEVILGLIILFFAAVGVLLFIFQPTFWIVDANSIKVFGVLMMLAGAMFLPGLIYRLCTNEKK